MKSIKQYLKEIERVQQKFLALKASLREEKRLVQEKLKEETRKARAHKSALLSKKQEQIRKRRWCKIIELREKGWSLQRIAEHLDITRPYASLLLKQATTKKESGEI